MASAQLAPKIDEQTRPATDFVSLGGGAWIRATSEKPYAELLEGDYFHAMMRFNSNPRVKHRIVVEYEVAKTSYNFGFDKTDVHLSATVVGSPITHAEKVQSQIDAIKEPNVQTTVSAVLDIDESSDAQMDQIQTNLYTKGQSGQLLGGLLLYSVTVKDAPPAE